MTISCMVAMDKNHVIGVENRLPWKLPADLKRLKEMTMGHAIIIGRKTYESIGKPLPGRTNIVITRQNDFEAPGCKVVHSLEEAIAAAGASKEIFILGGAEIYKLAMPHSHKLYVTRVETEVKGDAYFPAISPEEWSLVGEEAHEPDAKNPFRYIYLTYVRTKV